MVEFGVWMLRTLAPKVLKEIVIIGELTRANKLDWKMVRLQALKSKPSEGDLHIGHAGDGKFNCFKLTRADLAEFLLVQVYGLTYVHQAQAVSN